MQIKLRPADNKSPGFLRRLRQLTRFQQAIETKQLDEKTVVDMVEFLADFVYEPENRDDAIEALWDASEQDFWLMLGGISGNADPLAPKQDEKSNAG